MLMCVIIVCSYSILLINENGIEPSVVPLNKDGMWSMVGFSIYVYEGIGILMPVMQASSCPDQFDKIFVLANISITILYTAIGSIAYMAYGNLKVQAITEALPFSDTPVRITIFAYVIVIILTYPISIYPTNKAFETYTINRFTGKSSTNQYWLKNLSRFIICATAAYGGIELQHILDKFIALVGALTCAPLALIIPCFCHLNYLAKTKSQQIEDIILIMISLIVMIFCVI